MGLIDLGDDDASVAVGYRQWMLRLRRLGPRLLDVVVVGVGVWQQVALWSGGGGYRAAAAVAALASLACLLARDHTPLASRLGVFAALGVWSGITPHSAHAPPALFFSALVGFWVAGLARERSHAVAGAMAGLLLLAYDESAFPGGSAGDFVLTAVVSFAFWAGAYGIAQRGRHARVLVAEVAQARAEREDRTRRAVAVERVRIARELHDVVAHHLSVAVIQTVAALGELRPEADTTRHLQAVEDSCRQALAEMRRLLDVLRGEEIEHELLPAPGLARIEELVAGVRRAGLPLELVVEGEPLPLPPGLDLAAYRIAQEALTNALRHSGWARTRLALRYHADALELEVVDNGRGADRADGVGRGLVGMRERVTIYGGSLEVGPAADGGFRVHARLPVGPESG